MSSMPGQMTLTTLETVLGVDSMKHKPSIELFLQEYALNGGSAADAYLKAYPKSSRKAAVTNGCRLLKNEAVQQRLTEIRQELLQRYAVDAQSVVRLLTMSMNVDRRQFVNNEGKPLDLHELPPEAAAIADVEISIDRHGRKHARTVVVDRLKAAVELAKILGISREKIVITGDLRSLSDEQLEEEVQRLRAQFVKENPEQCRQLLEQIEQAK